MKGVAFCPAHITGFFKAELNQNDIELKGSLGAGFSIIDGVTTNVEVTKSEKSDYDLQISGYQPNDVRVSEFVINKFLSLVHDTYFVKVHHEISIPVGYGLGCSGAVALSLSLALNQAFNTRLSKTEIGSIAHIAEISCNTGLGDVLAAYHGGFEIRTKSGAPGKGSVEKIDVNSISVLMICFSPISTYQFLKERLPSINGLGGKMVEKLVRTKDLNEFQDMSLEFANYVNVLSSRMQEVINELHDNGIKCGVALFGETVFSLVPNHMKNTVLNIFHKYKDGIIINSKIDDVGARLTR